jgi:lysophospholipase L1-like esterase
MSIRSHATNILLSVTALTALVVILEVLLQVAVPVLYRPRFTRIDPVVGWYHTSSVQTVSTVEGHRYRESYNSHGYRGPEHSVKKTQGTLRVVVLGDSFVDGSEVGDDELFTWQLQEGLQGVEVINLGVYGYSTAQELITLEHVGLKYDPDIVLLVTLTNDFIGNGFNFSFFGPAPRFVLKGDSLVLESTSDPKAQATFRATNLPVPGMSFLHKNSQLYYFVNQYIYQRLISGRINEIYEEQRQSFPPSARNEMYLRLIQRMKEILDERGIDFLTVLAYERHELKQGDQSPMTEVRQALEANGIQTLDLYTDLRAAEFRADSSLYYRENIHWNARGHKTVAEILLRQLETWRLGRISNPRPNETADRGNP